MSGQPLPETTVPLPDLPPRATGWPARLVRLVRDALRLEDVLLIAWVAAQPVVLAALGHATATTGGGFDLLDGHDPWFGLVEALAVAGAVACLATRPSTADGGRSIGLADRGAFGPLAGGLLLAGVIAAQNLLGAGDAGFGVMLVTILVASLLPGALPAIPIPYRRVLVTPYVLVSASLFNGLMGQLGGIFDLHGLFDTGLGAALPVLPEALGLVLAFCGIYYLMLVYAPRQLAEAEGGLLTWLTRFGVFVAAEIVVATWLAGAV